MLDKNDLKEIKSLMNESLEEFARKILQPAFGSVDKRFESVEYEIGGIKNEIGGIKNEIGGIKNEINGIKGQINEMNAKITEMDGKITEMDENIGEVKEICKTALNLHDTNTKEINNIKITLKKHNINVPKLAVAAG